VRPGDPLIEGTLLGPLHTQQAVSVYHTAIDALRLSGAEIIAGGDVFSDSDLNSELAGGNFVRPTIAVPKSPQPQQSLWSKETFAPILNVAVFDEVEQAIEWNNSVPQGLSSSLWTRDIRNIGKWVGPAGSDCGIVNVRPCLN
jgi:aldehyde dehydrogenase family 7 protein A1